jgi:hypothetical protein
VLGSSQHFFSGCRGSCGGEFKEGGNMTMSYNNSKDSTQVVKLHVNGGTSARAKRVQIWGAWPPISDIKICDYLEIKETTIKRNKLIYKLF